MLPQRDGRISVPAFSNVARVVRLTRSGNKKNTRTESGHVAEQKCHFVNRVCVFITSAFPYFPHLRAAYSRRCFRCFPKLLLLLFVQASEKLFSPTSARQTSRAKITSSIVLCKQCCSIWWSGEWMQKSLATRGKHERARGLLLRVRRLCGLSYCQKNYGKRGYGASSAISVCTILTLPRNDAKTVSIVALGCFHPTLKVQSASIHFFLGTDEEEESSDDDEEVRGALVSTTRR